MRAIPATLIAAALGAGSLAGCSTDEMLRRLTPADADARARQYLGLFVEHRVADAEARLIPRLATPETHIELVKIDSVFGGAPLDSVRVVGSQVSTINGVRHANLTYEVRSAVGWIITNVATVDSANSWFVEGVSAQRMPQPLAAITAFTLAGRSPRHYAWLFVTVACALMSLGTAFWLASRREMPKRFRWVVFSLIGVGAFSIDWSTGDTAARAFHVVLFSAGVTNAGPFAPWIVTFAVPAGAIISLLKYREWQRRMARTAPAPSESSPA